MGLSKVISTLIGLISIVALLITLVTKSHDPLSNDRLSSGYEATRPHIPFASASCSFPKHCRRRRETGRDKERERERDRERERETKSEGKTPNSSWVSVDQSPRRTTPEHCVSFREPAHAFGPLGPKLTAFQALGPKP